MTKRYSNLDCIPTTVIRSILNDFACRGVDGADYMPVREELQAILWEREHAEEMRALKAFERREREYMMSLRTGKHARKSPKHRATISAKGN